jgi:hypothetical protein
MVESFKMKFKTKNIHVNTNIPTKEMPAFYQNLDILFNHVEVPTPITRGENCPLRRRILGKNPRFFFCQKHGSHIKGTNYQSNGSSHSESFIGFFVESTSLDGV